MNYRKDKYGNELSILGYGCMRFSRKGNGIDVDKAEKEVMRAINAGVNYLDTAYIYPGSEAALGEILARNHVREQVNVATKLPQYLIKSQAGLDKYFEEQLSRLQTTYVDYYLMHMLTDVAAWEKLCRLGVKEWIAQKKAEGKIRNIGFSFHGNTDMFLQILNAYDWDFCQIQYNYMDEVSQAGRKGLEAAEAKGIPVIIMEPLRGGKLVNLLPEEAKKEFAAYPVKRSPAEWAFRWLWNQSGVTVVLSGMNSEEMVQENLATASSVQVGEFTAEDFALIDRVKAQINAKIKVGCTGCAYCMPCPKGIDIPTTFSCYNHMFTEGKGQGRSEYLQIVAMQKKMSLYTECIKCGKCESHCPQHLPIREKLQEAGNALAPAPVRLGLKAVRLFKFW